MSGVGEGCVRVCMRACVRVVRMCRACVHACVHTCMRACVCCFCNVENQTLAFQAFISSAQFRAKLTKMGKKCPLNFKVRRLNRIQANAEMRLRRKTMS